MAAFRIDIDNTQAISASAEVPVIHHCRKKPEPAAGPKDAERLIPLCAALCWAGLLVLLF